MERRVARQMMLLQQLCHIWSASEQWKTGPAIIETRFHCVAT